MQSNLISFKILHVLPTLTFCQLQYVITMEVCDIKTLVDELISTVVSDVVLENNLNEGDFSSVPFPRISERQDTCHNLSYHDASNDVLLVCDKMETPISCELVAQSSSQKKGNFLKGCKWSPDGLCFLTSSNDNVISLSNTPLQALKREWKEPMNLDSCLSVHEPETVYDFCWWPLMSSQDPATCCFATTSKDQPVHLWDAFDGSLRASYIALNNVYEIQSAHSVSFSPDGQQLLCGYKKELCLFYTDRPGSTYEKWSTGKKKCQHNGQNNIISCVEFNPDGTIFACGSYDKTIGLYDAGNGEALEVLVAHNTGVTSVMFSADGDRLYTGARKEGLVKCWDIRCMDKPLFQVRRQVSTNQRIYFDLLNLKSSSHETHLISGSTNGNVLLWDIQSSIAASENTDQSTPTRESSYSFSAHGDCTNGCSVHPFLPLFLTSSGQRHFPEPSASDEEDKLFSYANIQEENCTKLWHAPFME